MKGEVLYVASTNTLKVTPSTCNSRGRDGRGVEDGEVKGERREKRDRERREEREKGEKIA